MRRAWYAAGAYAAMAIVLTWPLALGLARDVPGTTADAAAAMATLAWDGDQMIAVLRGHPGAALHYFDAGIFHPAPFALAYSDHLTAQAVQALPVYAATRNPILGYNLLFLSTFVLSGVGAFLLVRELTGCLLAAFVGGLLFAFAPYRMTQASHLAVLSAQWMPFALYATRRYMDSVVTRSARALRGGRVAPLAGAALAVIAGCLSGGDYLLYFTPFAAAYVVWEIGGRRMWGNLRMWAQLAAAAIAVTLVVVPFLLPYAVLHQALHLAHSRSEAIRDSADVYSYATAAVAQPLWGRIASAWPKSNAAVFPGLVALVLAVVGFVPGERRPAHRDRDRHPWRLVVGVLLAATALLYLLGFIAVLLWRHVVVDVGAFEVHISNANQVLLRGTAAFVLLCAVWAPARRCLAATMHGRGFFVLALGAAAWLSLGPQAEALGRPIELFAPYGLLYDRVAGFAAAGTPARYATIVALMLAVLAGGGAAVLARYRPTRMLLVALALVALAEGIVRPFPVNVVQAPASLAVPETRLHRPGRAPAIYTKVAALSSESVLAELPLGDREYDARAMFYSAVHRRPILNGYGEFFPPHYADLQLALSDVPRSPEVALDALRRLDATHVLVHEAAYLNGAGEKTSAALRQAGAIEVDRDGPDVLLKLP